MSYVIPSIQHTGTKFIGSMLKGYEWKSLHDECETPAIFVGHISKGMINQVKDKIGQYSAIIPLRHPFVVAESWKRRGKPETELIENFHLLVNEVDRFNPYYLALDGDDREEHLKYINNRLNINLQTDWNIVNSVSGTGNLSYKNMDPTPAMLELVEDIKGFLRQFY